MTDPNDPRSGDKQTSPVTKNIPGIFGANTANMSKKVGPDVRLITNKKPEKGVDESGTENLRNRFIAVAGTAMSRAKNMQVYVADFLEEGVLEGIIDKLNLVQKIVQEGNNDFVEKHEVYWKVIESAISELDTIDQEVALYASQKDEEARALQEELARTKNTQAEQLSRVKLIIPLTTKYQQLNYSRSRIENINTSIIPFKNDVIALFDELSWLGDTSRIDSEAMNKSREVIAEAEESIATLAERVADALVLIDVEEARKKTESDLIERMKDDVKKFEALLTEIDTLKLPDDVKKSLQEKETVVRSTKNTFDSTLLPADFNLFIGALEAYERAVQEAKRSSVVVANNPPAFLNRSTQTVAQTPDEEQSTTSTDPADTNDSSQSPTRAPGDIILPRISLNPKARGAAHKYKIQNADGKWETVPRVIWGTLNRYKIIFDNPEFSGKDFTTATKLKEETIDAIDAIDFDLADEKAQALGKELDTIESRNSSPQNTPTNTTEEAVNEEPTEPTASSFDDIKFRNPTRKNGNVLQIKIGDEFMNIPKGINFLLHRYLELRNDPTHATKDFTTATSYKEDIRNYVEEGNFTEANKSAKLLSAELEQITGKKFETKEKANNPPVGEIVTILTRGRSSPEDRKRQLDTKQSPQQEILAELDAWKKKWLDSGAIDTFRQKHGNITISDAQIATSKLLFDAYHEVIKRGVGSGLREGLVRSAQQNIIMYVHILAGVHHETFSDIKYIVEQYNERNDKEILKDLESQLQDAESGVANTQTKKGTLRPYVSGAMLSPKMQRLALEKSFELQKTVFKNANPLLEKVIPLLTSEEDKAMFAKIIGEVTQQQEIATANLTQESVALFTAKVEILVGELNKKVTLLTKMYGENLAKAPTTTFLPTATVMRSKRLRAGGPATESVADWQTRQQLQGSAEDIQKTIDNKRTQELTEKHNEMFERDPVLYKHLYGKTNTIRDTQTQAIADKTLEGKTPLTPKEHLVELNKEMEVLQAAWKKLHEDIAHGTAFGNPEGEKKVLQAKIELLNEKIQSYTKIVLDELTHPDKKISSLKSASQKYSPYLDQSLNDPTRGEYVQNKDKTISPLDRSRLSQEEVAELAARSGYTRDPEDNVIPVDFSKLTEEELQARKGTLGALNESMHPNHTKGMTSSITQDEAATLTASNFQPDKPYAVDDIEHAQALYNQDARNIQENSITTPEAKERKHTLVEKVSKWLFGYPSVKKFKWGYLAAGLTGFAITSGVGAAEQNNGGRSAQRFNNPLTLADVLKQEPTLEEKIADAVPLQIQSLILDPQRKNEEVFTDLLKIKATSFDINPANPSIKDKIRNLNCKMVYDVEGAGDGLTKEQQKESSEIINYLQKILIATKSSNDTLYARDVRLFDDKDTIYTFYEKVRSAVASHVNEQTKLRKI